ncbi:phage tail protein, partial [Bacillus cereus]|uniref:phage tail protein n=1 Tax=Bacillus cereus TaxID=1396 RepID=UPI0037BEC977
TRLSPEKAVWAINIQYSTQAANSTMNATVVSSIGGNTPHDNVMPFLTISFIIALYGIYPSF